MMTDILDELKWLKLVTEDDVENIYGRAIAEIERLRENAQADRNPEGHDPEEGHGAKHESPVAATSGDAPKLEGSSRHAQ